MKFYRNKTIPDVVLITPDPILDNRGFFAKTFGDEEFATEKLIHQYPQNSISYNKHKGTLRGLHYQEKPYTEAKLVSCIKGTIYDVAVDLRAGSSTFCRGVGYYLSEKDTMAALYIPPGFAHGYITLTDDVYVFYRVSVSYNANAEKGLMWNDQKIDIFWPMNPIIISDRDQNHNGFSYENAIHLD